MGDFLKQQIVLEGNQAFLRNLMVVECGQVVATQPWKCGTHGPLPQVMNVSRKVVYLLCAVVWLSITSVWLLQYNFRTIDPPKIVGIYSTNGIILPWYGLARGGALCDRNYDQETAAKRRCVFTSMSVGAHIKWVTNGNITQITMMVQGQFLKRDKERGVRKSYVLHRV